MKYYAVLDTNVLVSALMKRNSVPAAVLKHLSVVPLYNKGIFDEYEEVLRRAKFHFAEQDIQELFDSIRERGIMVDAESISDADFTDTEDVVFYEVVMEKRKTDEAWLVTGNIKHFPKETFIVTPREMLDIIEGVHKQSTNG